jgi:periplasmic protein TonB
MPSVGHVLDHLDPHTLIIGALFYLACSRSDSNTVRLPDQSARRGDEPPVMINPVSPVEYPRTLFARGIEGKVVLRLRVDEAGRLVGDSTKIAESSGYPALDSAALGAVPRFRFAPALRNGTPVAATFLQPIHFRHPEAGGTTP